MPLYRRHRQQREISSYCCCTSYPYAYIRIHTLLIKRTNASPTGRILLLGSVVEKSVCEARPSPPPKRDDYITGRGGVLFTAAWPATTTNQ